MAVNAAMIKELDQLYNVTDKLYTKFARACGLSSCAYWMVYDLICVGGTAPLTDIVASWAYSKQTINSALKALESQGLIELSFCEGSRRNKQVTLTAKGSRFAEGHIVPAMSAELRAFKTLDSADGAELLRLLRTYIQALEAEFSALGPEKGRPGSGGVSSEPGPSPIDRPFPAPDRRTRPTPPRPKEMT